MRDEPEWKQPGDSERGERKKKRITKREGFRGNCKEGNPVYRHRSFIKPLVQRLRNSAGLADREGAVAPAFALLLNFFFFLMLPLSKLTKLISAPISHRGLYPDRAHARSITCTQCQRVSENKSGISPAPLFSTGRAKALAVLGHSVTIQFVRTNSKKGKRGAQAQCRKRGPKRPDRVVTTNGPRVSGPFQSKPSRALWQYSEQDWTLECETRPHV